jgi:ribose/xylose/arabinose/galactoside ABC-type transport system permease subunit
MLTFAALVVGLGVGFALGRVKNAAKLASVKAELTKLSSYTAATAKAGIAKLKATL